MRVPALILTLALSLSLAACGDGQKPSGDGQGGSPPADRGATPVVAGETPEATFAAFRAATLRQDWNALYDLNAPSERAESEARWEKAKHDPENEAALTKVASDLQLSLDQLRGLSLRDYTMHRNAMAAAGHNSQLMRIAHEADYVKAVPVEGKDDVVMATFRIGESEPELPMKREDGRWYLWKMLTAITSF